MTKSNFGSHVAASPGCDAEPENVTEIFGPAAETGEDLANEGSGKEILKATFNEGRPAVDQKENGASDRSLKRLIQVLARRKNLVARCMVWRVHNGRTLYDWKLLFQNLTQFGGDFDSVQCFGIPSRFHRESK